MNFIKEFICCPYLWIVAVIDHDRACKATKGKTGEDFFNAVNATWGPYNRSFRYFPMVVIWLACLFVLFRLVAL